VAVLPLKNISPDPKDEYFADGLTEEFIATLSKVRELSVISSTSVMQYKTKPKPVAEIGRELNAGTILEGSVRKAANRVRITVQMIDAMHDKHLWAENYDRELQDVFTIQSDIAQRVATALEARLLESESKRIERGSTKNLKAYEEYLRGVYEIRRMTDFSLRNCISHLETAVGLDPSFAEAYAELGNAYVHAAGEEGTPPEPAYKKGKELIEKALSHDDTLSTAHSARGGLAMQYDLDWKLAETELRRAIELNPSNAEAHFWYSDLLAILRRDDESELEAVKARDLDPVRWLPEFLIAYHYLVLGRYEEAILHARKCVELDPDNPNTHLELGRVYYQTGRLDEGLEEAMRSLSLHVTLESKALLASLYATKGRSVEATTILDEIERNAKSQYFSPFRIGEIYLALGNRDRALTLFNEACEKCAWEFASTHHLPSMDSIREDPRYVALLRNYNLSS
jgi:TolB-like protein/Flp pilus assembly protein TadD